MNQPDRCESGREPLAIDLLLTADQRRSPSVAGHHEFRESIAGPGRNFDEIDRAIDDMIEVPWPELNPPSRRKDSEVNRVLSILDNLPTGKDEA